MYWLYPPPPNSSYTMRWLYSSSTEQLLYVLGTGGIIERNQFCSLLPGVYHQTNTSWISPRDPLSISSLAFWLDVENTLFDENTREQETIAQTKAPVPKSPGLDTVVTPHTYCLWLLDKIHRQSQVATAGSMALSRGRVTIWPLNALWPVP